MPVIHGKSKRSFEKNIKAEMQAGKPQDQALAIAYSVKRKAARKKLAEGGMLDTIKKELSSLGDAITSSKGSYADSQGADESIKRTQELERKAKGGQVKKPIKHPRMVESSIIKPRLRDEAEMMAKGGMIDDELEQDHHDSIAAAIMAKRERESALDSDSDIDEQMMMAEGGDIMDADIEHPGDEDLKEGEVDLDDNAIEMPNSFYHLNEDEVLEQNPDEDIMHMAQPDDSNDLGSMSEEETKDDDSQDIISKIRSKMAAKRMFR